MVFGIVKLLENVVIVIFFYCLLRAEWWGNIDTTLAPVGSRQPRIIRKLSGIVHKERRGMPYSALAVPGRALHRSIHLIRRRRGSVTPATAEWLLGRVICVLMPPFHHPPSLFKFRGCPVRPSVRPRFASRVQRYVKRGERCSAGSVALDRVRGPARPPLRDFVRAVGGFTHDDPEVAHLPPARPPPSGAGPSVRAERSARPVHSVVERIASATVVSPPLYSRQTARVPYGRASVSGVLRCGYALRLRRSRPRAGDAR